MFSDKSNLKRNITLVENGLVISEKKEVAETLNNYFIEAVGNLEIEKFTFNVNEVMPKNCDDNLQHNRDNSQRNGVTLSTNDTRLGTIANKHDTDVNIDDIISKYCSHPSIIIIKENVELDTKFEFCNVTVDEIYKEINALDTKKASVENDILGKILKGSNDIVSHYLPSIYNDSKKSKYFPVTPIHKEKETSMKKNYRLVSLLPILSKLYEGKMYDSIFSYIEKFLSPYLFGYRKGHSTQQCLLVMIETWRKALNDKKKWLVLFTQTYLKLLIA